MSEQLLDRLVEKLSFQRKQGHIFLDDYRMVMFSACALGALRKELLDTLGLDHARGLLKRFGYAAGLADGAALKERFPQQDAEAQMVLGPLLHAVEGLARMRRVPGKSQVDLAAGIFHVEGIWEGSFEAEQHLASYGQSNHPVCWTLCGYAQGHSTVAAGKPTVVVEQSCKAMGHDCCRFVVDFQENMSPEAEKSQQDFSTTHFPQVLAQLEAKIAAQQKELVQRDRQIQQLSGALQQVQPPPGMLGTSPAMGKVYDAARLVAGVESTVLVRGESGTGKELIARAIHQLSPRKEQVFFPVNCSVLPENMQEAELFGFAKGAFTGATQARAGIFEAAHGGTLFLDEIGDLAPSAQTKILRALQEGEIRRVGENRIRKVNVRVIAATHRDLEAMVAEGLFRQDLFYRLEVVTLDLPPLRERANDALLLANHFCAQFSQQFQRTIEGLDYEALCLVARYPWPGNVRELEHAIERAVILASGNTITIHDLPEKMHNPEPGLKPEMERPANSLQPDEQTRIIEALRVAGGNKAKAARLLSMGRTTLWRKMRQYNLDKPT